MLCCSANLRVCSRFAQPHRLDSRRARDVCTLGRRRHRRDAREAVRDLFQTSSTSSSHIAGRLRVGRSCFKIGCAAGFAACCVFGDWLLAHTTTPKKALDTNRRLAFRFGEAGIPFGRCLHLSHRSHFVASGRSAFSSGESTHGTSVWFSRSRMYRSAVSWRVSPSCLLATA